VSTITLSSDQAQALADRVGLKPPYDRDAPGKLIQLLMAAESPYAREHAFRGYAAATGLTLEEVSRDPHAAEDSAWRAFAAASGIDLDSGTASGAEDLDTDTGEAPDGDLDFEEYAAATGVYAAGPEKWSGADEAAWGEFAAATGVAA
jgi:hypothetical protein